MSSAINRVHSEAQTHAVIDAARRADYASVSVDPIDGLARQSPQTFHATLERVIALRPDRIAVYNYAHLPMRFRSEKQISERDMLAGPRPLASDLIQIKRATARARHTALLRPMERHAWQR